MPSCVRLQVCFFLTFLSSLNRRVPPERADVSLRRTVHQSPRTCLSPRNLLGNEEKWVPVFFYFLFFAFNLFLMNTQINSLSGLFFCHQICPVCTFGTLRVRGCRWRESCYLFYNLHSTHPSAPASPYLSQSLGSIQCRST